MNYRIIVEPAAEREIRSHQSGPAGFSMIQCFGGNSLTTAAVIARMPVEMLGPGSG